VLCEGIHDVGPPRRVGLREQFVHTLEQLPYSTPSEG
jgi:hypothetical protein